MKSLKKLIVSLLTVALIAASFTVTAFAEETTDIPEYAEVHTITIEVEPDQEFVQDFSNPGIMPFIWGSGSYNPPANGATTTGQFTIPQRYFAYEMRATATNGAALSSSYSTHLLAAPSLSAIASLSGTANGTTYKKDWITVSAGSNYLFRINNSGSTTISVTLTYYSWA